MKERKYEMMKRSIESLGKMSRRDINFKDVVVLISNFQKEDGTFDLISGTLPNDIKVYFNEETTYICTSIYIKAYLYEKEWFEENIGLNSLRLALEECTIYNLFGHGYEAFDTQIKSMNIFIKNGLKEFIRNYFDINNKFSKMIIDILNDYKKRVDENNYKYGFSNYEVEIKKVLREYEI